MSVWAVDYDYCDVSKTQKGRSRLVRWLDASGDELEMKVHLDDALLLAPRPEMATIADDD